MTHSQEITFGAGSVGVWLDGVHGWHNLYRVAEIARDYGWEITDGDAAYLSAFCRQLDYAISPQTGEPIGAPEIADAVREIADDATEYLTSLCESGYWFEWSDGDFILTTDACEVSTVAGGERYCDAHDSAAPCPIGGGE